MAEVSSLSLLTSIDSLVQQYRASLRKPVVSLENRKTTLNARLSVLADLKTKLNTLYTTVKDLSLTGSSSKFLVYSVSSTLPSIATATATSSAAIGTHTLLVTQLAKADTVLSSQFTSSGTSIVTAEGTGTKTIRLSVNGVNTDVNVTLSSGDTNSTVLSNIASAINASGASVSASVVSDTSTTSRLVLTSKQTGSSNAISLSDVTGTLLDNIGLTDAIVSGRTASTSTTGGFVYSSTSSLNANFKLDSIDIVRESNSVSDALTGVTLELKGTQNPSDTPVTLTVGVDTAEIQARVQKFITDYNDVLGYITSKTSVDPSTHTRQILAGDTVFLNLRTNLRSTVFQQVTSVVPGNPSLLSQIGITVASDGTLSLSDSAKFTEALTTDVVKVSDLFNSTSGIAIKLENLLDTFVTTGGQIDTTVDGVNDQVSSLTSRIKRLDEQINRKVERFRNEFARLQSLMDNVTWQQRMIQSLTTGGFFL